MRVKTVVFAMMLAAVMAVAGCSRKKAQDLDTGLEGGGLMDPNAAGLMGGAGAGGSQGLGMDSSLQRPPGAGVASGALKTVYFDYDRSDIRYDQRQVLDENYEYLKANPQVQVIIEGHCDSRGTLQYNYALGERRAVAAREYLIVRGVQPDRLSTISKGEDEPAVMGENEAAYAANRRVELKLMGY
ncbi:MAG: Peptidoglycan-associated lipoprotein precursor [candidate division BRC1 bacterium ADurb.BinA364]|nr:MAG: Peptidoglycan-associated lipoprotein precursor [candidate division BRC1 bacterium ADurb.BinA364]